MAKRRRGRGEGGVEQLPSGSWRAVTPSRTDPATGKRVRDTKTCPTKPEALAWLAEQTARPKAAATGTVGEWLTDWLARHKLATGTANYESDKQTVEQHIRPKLAAVKLRDLDRRVLSDFLAGLDVTANTRHVVGRTLRKLLNAAVDAGRLTASPMARMKIGRKADTEARSLTAADLLELVAVADGLGFGVLARVGADTGCRPSELLGLQWGDFDPARGTLTIRRSVDRYTGKLKEPKTKRSRRTIPLSGPTRAALTAYRPDDVPDTRPVFGSNRNTHRRYRNYMRDVWAKIHAALPDRLRWVTPYTLRHTCASLLLQAGVSLRTVSERLGHTDVSLTLRVYAHSLPGDQEKAAGVMGQLLPTVLPTPAEKPCLPS